MDSTYIDQYRILRRHQLQPPRFLDLPTQNHSDLTLATARRRSELAFPLPPTFPSSQSYWSCLLPTLWLYRSCCPPTHLSRLFRELLRSKRERIVMALCYWMQSC